MPEKIEIDPIPCLHCKKAVLTRWSVNDDGTNNGMLPDPGVTLVANWVYHTGCWDALMNEYFKHTEFWDALMNEYFKKSP